LYFVGCISEIKLMKTVSVGFGIIIIISFYE